jgi:hypothetical protein
MTEQEICNNCGKSLREQMKGCNEITCYRQFLNKQETLEEVAERIFNIPDDKKGDIYFGSNIAHLRKGFKLGAKWQKEKISNSIEQVIKDICKDNTHLLDTPEIQEIIKYFKK